MAWHSVRNPKSITRHPCHLRSMRIPIICLNLFSWTVYPHFDQSPFFSVVTWHILPNERAPSSWDPTWSQDYQDSYWDHRKEDILSKKPEFGAQLFYRYYVWYYVWYETKALKYYSTGYIYRVGTAWHDVELRIMVCTAHRFQDDLNIILLQYYNTILPIIHSVLVFATSFHSYQLVWSYWWY